MRRITTNYQHLLTDVVAALTAQGIIMDDAELDSSRTDTEIRLPGLGKYRAVFRTQLTPNKLGPLKAHIQNTKLPTLLVADYIPPKTAERLRADSIQFVDTAGNAYLYRNKPRVYIWIEGHKSLKRRRVPVTAFRARGLRVIFPLLCLGTEALKAPYRQIAGWAGVALGTVANTINDLTEMGYLRKTQKTLIIEDREKLLRRWVEEYPQELRPLLNPRRYKTDIDQWMDLGPSIYTKFDIQLGGETAAMALTQYLHAETVTIYGQPDLKQLVPIVGPLTLNDNGPLEIVDRFWNFASNPTIPGQSLCPHLLVYADLLASGEGRQLETAQLLREQYVI